MSAEELRSGASEKGYIVWIFRVRDKFGDAGLTEILSLEMQQGRARIVDFLLSCRVMGRKIEETMLYTAVAFARGSSLDEIYAFYHPTDRNKPCLEFWKSSGSTGFHSSQWMFTWDLLEPYPLPGGITIESGQESES